VWHHHSREKRSVVHNCCGPSPAQSFSGLSPAGLRQYFTVPDSRLPQPGGPGPRIYIHHEQGGPVIRPGTGFPFRRLLRLAGLRWRYSNPPPRGEFSRCLKIIQLIYQFLVRASQETYYISATETNRLMLFGETVAVYCENEVIRNKLFVLNQVVHVVTISR
jgi:hypothetical protein